MSEHTERHNAEKRLRQVEDESQLQQSEVTADRLSAEEDTSAAEQISAARTALAAQPEMGKIPVRFIRSSHPTQMALRDVERLFRSSPLIDAPAGFADRVLTALTARTASAPTTRRGRGRWRLPWFAWALILFLPIGLVVGTAALALGPGPAALGLLMQRAVLFLNELARQAAIGVAGLAGAASMPGVVAATLIGSAALLVLWAWLMLNTNAQRQQVVYRVPVRFH